MFGLAPNVRMATVLSCKSSGRDVSSRMLRARIVVLLVVAVVGARATQAQSIRGVVVDAATRNPIEGTIIQAGSDRGNQRRTTTDSAGSFFLSLPGSGLYTVVATRIGYIQHRGDTVRVGDAEAVALRIELDRSVILLRPVIITERLSWLPDGFEQRRAAGFGRFLTRTDIENRRGSNTTDLLRGMPGLQLTPMRRGRGTGSILQMRGPGGLCSPAVWIDGIPLNDGGSSIDQLLNPSVLEAVEVYNSTSNAPIQYRTGTCGVVLFWTKRGPDENRVKTRWWKLALGATAGIGLVVLMRGRGN